MDRRHQVFVSSTYTDLKDERSEAIQALLELDCMPAGMELFPAANEEQWKWIQKIIDESDYYIVIIGGRYGSVHPASGISYTEMEYRYALETGKPVIAFLHEDLAKIENGKSDTDPALREKLKLFRELCQKKLVKYWNSPTDLAAKLSRSLTRLIKDAPRPGWIRADKIEDSIQLELLQLKEANRRLSDALLEQKNSDVATADVAQGDDKFKIPFWIDFSFFARGKWVRAESVWRTIVLSWDQIYTIISPALNKTERVSDVREKLIGFCANEVKASTIDASVSIGEIKISADALDQIGSQFTALGFITQQTYDGNAYWRVTDLGQAMVIKALALKRGEEESKLSLISKTLPVLDALPMVEEEIPF